MDSVRCRNIDEKRLIVMCGRKIYGISPSEVPEGPSDFALLMPSDILDKRYYLYLAFTNLPRLKLCGILTFIGVDVFVKI